MEKKFFQSTDNPKNKPKDPQRRKFLKAVGVGAAGLGFGLAVFPTETWLVKTWRRRKEIKEKLADIKQQAKEMLTLATPEQEEIEQQEREVIGETLIKQLKHKNKIILTKETKRAIYERWLKSYSPEGKNYRGLLEALNKMKPWINQMKEEFKKTGVPEEYVFLTIPESHFKLKAVSSASAVGPFQFIRSTAKKYNLKIIPGVYDERLDPIKSARACARHLKDSYQRFNNSWELALADYNGGYTNQYAKETKKKERNYEHYLKWREERINKALEGDFLEHKVGQIKKGKKKIGETLGHIAKRYGVSVEELKKINDLKSDHIKLGQKLKLPNTFEVRKIYFSASLENLNYPEKFFAVLKVIEKEQLEKKYFNQSAKRKHRWITALDKEVRFVYYTVKRGDTLYRIAKKFGVKVKIIKRNNGLKNNDIRPGERLKIGRMVMGMSLRKIGRERKISLDKLKKLNPAVLNEKIPLNKGIKIRIS